MSDEGPSRSVAELERAVQAAVRRHGLASGPEARLLDLVSEVGELAKELLESSAYGAGSFTRSAAWDEELGDVAFSLFALGVVTGTPVEPALERALAKVEQRVAGTGSASSGRHPTAV